MKENVAKTQKECRKIIMREAPKISNCQINQESSLHLWNSIINILSSIAFIISNSLFPVHIKEIDSFFEEGQSQAIWIPNIDSMKWSSFGGNASGRKGGIILQQYALISNTLNQQQNSQHFDNIFKLS